MKKLIFIMVVLITMVGCKKDQKAVNTLEGSWKAQSYIYNAPGETGSTINQIAEDSLQITFQFAACKLKTANNCSCTYTVIGSDGKEDIKNFTYTINEEGTKLFLTKISSLNELVETYNVTSLTKEQLVLSASLTDGSKNRYILVKQ